MLNPNSASTTKDRDEKQAIPPLAYALLGWMAVLTGLEIISQNNYLLFHTLAELFSIIIAGAIFTVAWNSRRFSPNGYLLIVGISLLFAGTIDFLHIITYKGIGVFPDIHTNIATQLWLAARYLQSISLLIASIWLYKKNKDSLSAVPILLTYLVATSFLLLSIFHWRVFPVSFVDGVGLTPFKKISEYLISAILLTSLFPLAKKEKEFDRSVFWLIVWSITTMVASELAFTFYADPYGLLNKTGHFLKIISFYLIYQAIVVANFKNPFALLFKNLKQKETALAGALKNSQQTLESLKISEQLYQDALVYTQSIIDTVKQPLLVLDEKLKIDSANKTFYKFFRTSPSEIEKSHLSKICNRQLNNPELTKLINKAFTADDNFSGLEITISCHKLGKKILLLSGKKIKRPENRPALLLLGIDDITERKRAEEKIEHLATFPQLNPNLIIELNAGGEIIFYNPSVRHALKNLGAEKNAGIFLPNDISELIGKLNRAEEGPSLFSREIKIKDRVFSESIHLLKKLSVARIYATDITERKIAEETLRQSQKNLQSLFESDIIGIIYADEKNILEANDYFLKMLGYSRQDLSDGKIKWDNLLTREYLDADSRALKEMIKSGSCAPYEKESLKKDGGRLPILIGATVLDRSPLRWASFILDITKRKQAEQLLRETKDYLEKLFNHANAPIIVWGPDKKIAQFNHAFEQLTGYWDSEVIGQNLDILFPPDSKKESLEKILQAAEGKNWKAVEIPILRKDRGIRTILWNSANIYNDYYDEKKKALIATLAQGQDITELKRVDRAKTEFISLAAHQLRTPLATIRLTAEMLLRGVAGDANPDIQKYLESISDDIRGMTEMIETFLNISRIEIGTFPIEPKPANLIKSVDDILEGIHPQISDKKITLKKNYCSDSLIMNLDQRAMRVAIDNILSNAIKYTDEKGSISVSIAKDGNEAIIKIADNGWGIPENQHHKIFEKMYRATNVQNTKAEGVGLGLYMVKSVLEQASGRIWFESKKGKGTTFYIGLPLEGMKKKPPIK